MKRLQGRNEMDFEKKNSNPNLKPGREWNKPGKEWDSYDIALSKKWNSYEKALAKNEIVMISH